MTERPVVLVMQPHLAPVTAAIQDRFDPLPGWADRAHDAVAEAVIVAGEFPLDKDRIAAMPRLKLIACFTSGYDGIDVAWAQARGLPVTHAPAVNHDDVADHALGLILASRRRIADGDRMLRSGGWKADAKMITRSMRGQRLGIVGLGRIGEALAVRGDAIGLEVAWWAPRPKATRWPRMDSLEALATWAEVLVVACRADETNRGRISAEVISALGPEGLLVNVARGQLVDEDALIAALKSGALGAAALDVYAEEPTSAARWADVPNTVLTPHTAGATREAVVKMVQLLVANLTAVLGGGEPVTPVSP